MRKLNTLFTLLVLCALLLAACGGAAEETPGIEGTEALPETGAEATQALPGTGAEATEAVEATETEAVVESPTAEATEAVTEAVTEAATTEAPAVTAAPGLPGAGVMFNPDRLSNLLALNVQNVNGDILGDVENMVIDLGNSQIQHVILASGGFLGIGEQLIPVPWEVLSLNPECTTAAQGAGGTGQTGGTGTAAGTETPDAGGTTGGDTGQTGTETPDAGGTTGGTGQTGTATPGTGTTDDTGEAGAGQAAGADVECYFLLNADDEMLQNAPNFEVDQLPDISTPGWDAEFNEYWTGVGGAAGGTGTAAGTSTPGTGAGAGTATPGTGAGTAGTATPGTGAAGTATPGTGDTGATGGTDQTGAAGAQLILADELLEMEVVSGAGGGQAGGTGQTGGTDTATPGTGAGTAGTATPGTGAGAAGTATPGTGDTGATGAGQAAEDEVLGTVTDAIVDLQTGAIRYLLISANETLGDDLLGMLIPVPAQAATITGTEDERMLMLNVDRDTLSGAPAFDEVTFPTTVTEDWETDLETYWSDFVTTPSE